MAKSKAGKNLSDFGGDMRKIVENALLKAGHELKNKAIPLTPFDTGALRRSLNVGFPKVQGGTITVEVGADGRSAPYALAVHERTGAINYKEPGTGAKYLERPFNSMQREIGKMMANEIETAIKRGF